MQEQSISLNGLVIDLPTAQSKIESNIPDWEKDIFRFLIDW